jgi:hypothetical protein
VRDIGARKELRSFVRSAEAGSIGNLGQSGRIDLWLKCLASFASSWMTDIALRPTPAAIAALRADPQFQSVMRELAGSMVARYRGNRLLNSLINDRARAVFTHGALYLHYSAAPADAGFTVGAIKDFCVEHGLCSRGRCEATLALMRAAGYFAAAPSGDRRRRPLVPTAKLLALHRERWSDHFRAMRRVLPQGERYRNALDDPDFFKRFVLTLGAAFSGGFRLLENAPELEIFAERNAGMVILLSLALGGPPEGPFPPVAPVPLSINALATAFAVSRKHVLTLLRDAQAEGLLERGAGSSQIRILPRARSAIEILLATICLFLAEGAAQSICPQPAAQDSAEATVL